LKEVIIKFVSCETILFHLGAVSNVQMFKCLALFPLHSDEITQQKIPPIRFSPKLDLCFIYLFSSFAKNVLLSFALFWHPRSQLLILVSFFFFFLVFTCCSKMRWQFIHRLSMKKNSRIFRFINCPSSILSHCECLPAKCLRV